FVRRLQDLDVHAGSGLAGVGDRADAVVLEDDGHLLLSGVVAAVGGYTLSLHDALPISLDRLLVVVEVCVRAGRLTHGVVAGVDGDCTRSVTDASIGPLRHTIDLEVEPTGVGGGNQVLDDLDLARLACVGDGARDVFVEV